MDWIEIDGSLGEGGGQILRTALALASHTGRPMRVTNIRARRSRPGLMRQHLAAIAAAAEIAQAEVYGASLGSTWLEFRPRSVAHGDYRFAVGTAGSATLVCQTVLPPLLMRPGTSHLVFEGGTHNPMAPPADFLLLVFFPWLRRLGGAVEGRMVRAGFYPAGGGRLEVEIQGSVLQPRSVQTRGPIERRRARAIVANLPRHIAQRELDIVRDVLGWARVELVCEEVASDGPGNVLLLEVEFPAGVEAVAGFGQKGVPAERIARLASRDMSAFLEADVPVGEYLADQLLLPLALAGGGAIRSVRPSLHTTTNATVIERFLGVHIQFIDGERGDCEVRVNPPGAV